MPLHCGPISPSSASLSPPCDGPSEADEDRDTEDGAGEAGRSVGGVSELPLSVLDLVPIAAGATATDAIGHSIELARHVERLGYSRVWFAEHHNMSSLACSVPELLIARIATETSTMRVGAGGIMLPNHAPLRVAEEFRTLEAMFPGRIDLGLGRAPGTDGTTAWALRRNREAVVNDEFVTLAAQLFAFLDAGGAYPDDHPFASVMAAPRVPSPPQIWMLGSSGYGGAFAAVNGMPTAFAHHINPAPAVASLRSYRREFQPSERADAPYSAIAVNAFASDDPSDADDYVALQTLLWWRLRRNELRPMTIAEAREFALRPDYDQIRDGLGRELFVGSGAEVFNAVEKLAAEAEADEVMILTNHPDHDKRMASYELIAGAAAPR
jgi:luciferase family oxidoreductase group 1